MDDSKGAASINNHRRQILWRDYTLLLSTVVLFAFFSVFARGFFTWSTFLTILRSMSIIAVLGLGLTFVITAGEIDLSIGTVPAMVGAILAALLDRGMSLVACIPIALGSAAILGVVNALPVVKAGIPSIIITLASYMMAQGVAYIVTGQHPVIVNNETFVGIFGNQVCGIPVIVMWMVGLLLVGYIVLHKTKFGRNVSLIGDNRAAAYYAGINVDATLSVVFVICALYAFFAGMLGVARASNAAPWMITPDMMTAIAAPLVGGTSLAGGKGNMVGTVLGAFFLTMISNGLLIFGIEQWVLYLINGIIIIAALGLQYAPRRQA